MSATPEYEVRQEPDLLSRWKIMTVTVISFVTTLFALAVAWVLLDRWGQEARHEAPPPAPRTIGILEQTLILSTERGVDLRRKQATELEGWAWADRDAGVARIPIETAIEVLAASPLPPDRPLAPRRTPPMPVKP